MSVARSKLVPGQLYWARSSAVFAGQITIVEMSSVFGRDPDCWTVAIMGSDQHYMPGDFEFLAVAEPPQEIPMQCAAE